MTWLNTALIAKRTIALLSFLILSQSKASVFTYAGVSETDMTKSCQLRISTSGLGESTLYFVELSGPAMYSNLHYDSNFAYLKTVNLTHFFAQPLDLTFDKFSNQFTKEVGSFFKAERKEYYQMTLSPLGIPVETPPTEINFEVIPTIEKIRFTYFKKNLILLTKEKIDFSCLKLQRIK